LQALLHSPDVDIAAMTGCASTYDQIVWGSEEAKATGKKLLEKPFFAELGACSPYVIVPGHWSEKDIDRHAEMLAALKIDNGGSLCASPQVQNLHRRFLFWTRTGSKRLRF
jgi:acyl-CoA reductase-like NAD-dependent aldehyde dehydrogenase